MTHPVRMQRLFARLLWLLPWVRRATRRRIAEEATHPLEGATDEEIRAALIEAVQRWGREVSGMELRRGGERVFPPPGTDPGVAEAKHEIVRAAEDVADRAVEHLRAFPERRPVPEDVAKELKEVLGQVRRFRERHGRLPGEGDM